MSKGTNMTSAEAADLARRLEQLADKESATPQEYLRAAARRLTSYAGILLTRERGGPEPS